MNTPPLPFCQRWNDGRHSWRHPDDGGFDQRRYDVAPVATDIAKRFVLDHHYSGSFPSDILRYGLFDRGDLVGVAVLSWPGGPKVLGNCFPELPKGAALELGRFVLVDDVPANGESWFLARAFKLAARDGIAGVVSFSDPVARTADDGTIVFPGHLGTIYQASNAEYTGRSSPQTKVLLRDGRVLDNRALTKLRRGEVGSDYVERLLVTEGARPMRSGESTHAWLREALDAAGARRFRHHGQHRYAFRIGPRRRHVVVGFPSAPYPKELAA